MDAFMLAIRPVLINPTQLSRRNPEIVFPRVGRMAEDGYFRITWLSGGGPGCRFGG